MSSDNRTDLEVRCIRVCVHTTKHKNTDIHKHKWLAHTDACSQGYVRTLVPLPIRYHDDTETIDIANDKRSAEADSGKVYMYTHT